MWHRVSATQIWSTINNSSENIFCYIVYYKYNPYSQLCSKCLKHCLAHDKHLNKWMLLRDVFASSTLINSLFWISKFENITCQTLFLYLYNWLWMTTKIFLCIREFLLLPFSWNLSWLKIHSYYIQLDWKSWWVYF